MNEYNANTTRKFGLSMSRKRRGLAGWIFGGLTVLLILGLFVAPVLFYALHGTTYAYYPYPFFFFPFGFIFFLFVGFFVLRLLFWGRGGWGWGGGYYRGYWGHRGYGYGYSDATDILRQRYAKGEITKDQFDQMMKDLQAHDTA